MARDIQGLCDGIAASADQVPLHEWQPSSSMNAAIAMASATTRPRRVVARNSRSAME